MELGVSSSGPDDTLFAVTWEQPDGRLFGLYTFFGPDRRSQATLTVKGESTYDSGRKPHAAPLVQMPAACAFTWASMVLGGIQDLRPAEMAAAAENLVGLVVVNVMVDGFIGGFLRETMQYSGLTGEGHAIRERHDGLRVIVERAPVLGLMLMVGRHYLPHS